MALVTPVIPPFYLSGALSAEGLVLPVSANDAAALCSLIGTGNHTYFRITSAQALEVVKAQCTGTVVQIDRAINESFAVAHPLGACVTVDVATVCALRDAVCQELDQCDSLADTIEDLLLASTTFPPALVGLSAFTNALCANTAFKTCLTDALEADATFLAALVDSTSDALLASTPFQTSLISGLLANSAFLTGVTAAISSSPTLLAAVANAVLNSPNFCSSVTSCVGSSGGGSIGGCPAATITQALSPTTATVGTAYTGTFRLAQTTGVVVNNLPAGLTASLAVTTGIVTITGTPVSAGVATVTVTATNACGSATPTTVTLGLGSLTVAAAGGGAGACPQPAITTPLTPATATAGTPYTGTVTVTNTTGMVLTGLPSWATATFNQGTQLITITGTPTAPMTSVTVTLTNACGGAFTTSTASGVPIGPLAVSPPTLGTSTLPGLLATCAGGGSPPVAATLLMNGITASGATGWTLVQSSPSASWNLPASPQGINVMSLAGFVYGSPLSIQATGPWGATNLITVVVDTDPCPGGA